MLRSFVLYIYRVFQKCPIELKRILFHTNQTTLFMGSTQILLEVGTYLSQKKNFWDINFALD